MSDSSLEWYAVKGLFRWFFRETGETMCVEERVVLFEAAGFDEALDKAAREALSYCTPDPTANFEIEPIGWWNACSVDQRELTNGTEIYSRLMKTSLSAARFVRRYCPTSHDGKL